MHKTEQLRDALLDAQRALERERSLRHEADALLAGVRALTNASSTQDLLQGLFDELRKWLAFENGALLEKDSLGRLAVAASTLDDLGQLCFVPTELTDRVIAGEPVALFDTSRVEDWRGQSAAARNAARSVLYLPLRGDPRPMVLVCAHSRRGFFAPKHLALGRRLAPLIAHVLTKLELARSVEGFREFIDRSPDAVFIRRGETIVYVNEALVSLLGYTRAELAGADPITFIHPDDHKEILDHRLIVPQPPARMDQRWLHKDRRVIEVEAVGANLHFDGQLARVVQARDVTERNRMQGKLALSDRLATVGTLAAGVAHEINNPLAFVIANLDVIAEDIPGITCQSGAVGRDLTEAVRDAQMGAERIRRIVGGLRAFSHGDQEQRALLDLRTVLDQTILLTLNEVRHRARLETVYGATPVIEADQGRLGQVFVNLFVNAAQAIPEGQAARNTIRVTTHTDAIGWAVVEVQDTGGGIPESILGRIFDPFFTTKAIGVGIGIGLAICRNIVASYGGEIAVESREGCGATFRVRLPPARRESAAHEPSAEPHPPSSRPTKRARVLIIDDDAMVAFALKRALREHDVSIATDGDTGIAALLTSDPPDVVLCDLMMPDTDGMQIFTRVTMDAPDLLSRIVFMTGGAFTPAATRFLSSIPNEYFEKPIGASTLRALVQRMAR